MLRTNAHGRRVRFGLPRTPLLASLTGASWWIQHAILDACPKGTELSDLPS